MNDIDTLQDEIIAIIDALIVSGDVDSTFSTQDNDMEKGTLPLVIVDYGTSDPTNLSDGGTALADHSLKLIVVAPISDHEENVRATRNFVIDNFMPILNNLSVQCGKVYYEQGVYNKLMCVRARTDIIAY